MVQSGKSRSPGSGAEERRVRTRIERAVLRARLVMLWETVWPALASMLVLAAVFAIVSWFGLWRVVSDPVRYGILAVFVAAAAFLLFNVLRARRPARLEALSRIEAASGLLHRPATALTDPLAVGANDPAAEALWAAHRTRLLAALDRLKSGLPSPGLARRDPWALRFLAVLLLVVAFVYAGPNRVGLLAEAFRGGEPTAVTIARVDAWVTPPGYTGRPPIFLTGEAAKPAGTEYGVPVGSVVIVRTSGANDLTVLSSTAAGEAPAEVVPVEASKGQATAAAPLEQRLLLDSPGDVVVRKGERELMRWHFAVEPDHAPQIDFARLPAPTLSGALNLGYTLKDDYGIVEARAEIAPRDPGPSDESARPLFDAPTIPLSLPQLRTRDGVGETIRDLTAHPWAGAKVRVTLVARDEADQEGRSAPVEIDLPARRFVDPLARAVVEQRARLAMNANAAPQVGDALDALTLAPEDTFDDIGDYLGLRTAYHRLNRARSDDDLRELVDYLWAVALGIEDGDLSLAAQQLRAAQEALRQALENGASDEEIERLTAELREALREFMQALAEEARRNPNLANLPPSPDTRMLRSQDLERMLDQIEDLARNGARDAARQLLSELQNMMENLQAGRPMMGNQQSGEMMQSLNELADMIRRQQELMDETHRAQRGLGEDGEPMTAEEMAEALRRLQEQQQGLEQALGELMEQMEGMGMQPGEGNPLGEAGEAMGRAAGDLGNGRPGSALGNQGAALEALRQGAQGLAQQLTNQGPGFAGNPGGRQMPNTDPLGRPQRTTGPDLGSTVKVPDEIDIQRAREILEAIRERLSEPDRPLVERNYLERLLNQF